MLRFCLGTYSLRWHKLTLLHNCIAGLRELRERDVLDLLGGGVRIWRAELDQSLQMPQESAPTVPCKVATAASRQA